MYTINQFTYFIYYLFQDKFNYSKIIAIQQVHQKIYTEYKTSLNIGNNLLPRHIACKFEATRIYR